MKLDNESLIINFKFNSQFGGGYDFSIENTIPVIELSKVLQGEGKYIGTPSILIRMSGCKLRCCFENSICDTWYASFSPEKGKFSLKDINEFFNSNDHIEHCFITGGGPTANPKLLQQLVSIAKWHDKFVTIETEGSEGIITAADFISLSPKLSNSTPVPRKWIPELKRELTEKDKEQHEKYRKNYEAMKLIINNHPDYQLKPVVTSNIETDILEVKEIQKELSIPNNKVWLMPEGINREQLDEIKKKLVKICIDEGYHLTDRLHINIFGNIRGV